MKRKTQEEFTKEVNELVNKEYTVLGEYLGNKVKILMRHNSEKCGFYEYEVSPIKFLKGNRCPKCSGLMRKTTSTFKEEVLGLVGEEYVVLGGYINAYTKIKFKHNGCNEEFNATPTGFLSGRRCPKCCKYKKKTHEDFVAIVENAGESEFGNKCEFSVLSEYINCKEKVKIRHNCTQCDNHIFETTPDSFINAKSRCPKCSNINLSFRYKHSQDDFEKIIFELVGEEYSVSGEYVNARTKILMTHNNSDCNFNQFLVNPYHFINGTRCPRCYESKGEKKVRKWLELNNIAFIEQYEVEGLVGIGGKNLRFDFALFNNHGLMMKIEYDGEFHFNKIYEGDGHEMIVEHDKRKDEYCKENNITLIRIPYWKFNNIEEILTDELHNCLSTS